FVLGMEDGVFPHSRALDEGGLEEERRLFYVGVTRAMRKLHLTHARRRTVFGSQAYGLPSRFLGEIPAELTEQEQAQITIMSAARGGAVSWPSAPRPPVPGERFRLGEDVIHASFGEGVVTGIDPDAVTVRFAGDGAERKLLTEFGTLARR
ncbi:MAG TPA: 3'-5' exonuclease, partial [Solirubrobacteraceae bacterium]|nr:3'-5' exonuclease [Solirubrobacteraceae bacterium]